MNPKTLCGYDFGLFYCFHCDNYDYCQALIKENINKSEDKTNGTKNFKTRSTGL